MLMNTRRDFLKLTGSGILAAGMGRVSVREEYPGEKCKRLSSSAGPYQFSLAMAGYTFARFDVEKSISMMKRINVLNVCLKDFHLPLDSTPEQAKAIIDKFNDAGITVYAVGVIYMKTREAVDKAFESARLAGTGLIVGAPNTELLSYVEEKVKVYNIWLAIHNHGPDNPLYPNAADIWEHVKELDKRVGMCIDIGHTTRDGRDPSADIKKFRDRVFDIHVKDVDKPSKEGKTVEMGRGIIDIPGVVATLRDIKYAGKCSLEFEKDMNDPLAGIAESIGYFRGVMAACK
jgi:sugar phosphate isomerase/epimerase